MGNDYYSAQQVTTIYDTMEKPIKIAIENGYDEWMEDTVTPWSEADKAQIVMSPLFWQALGKGLGWEDMIHYDDGVDEPVWLTKQKELIDHLAEGKDIESFFKTITI